MNTARHLFSFSVLVLGSLAAFGATEPVATSELPAPVQQAVSERRQSGSIERVEREHTPAGTIYSVKIVGPNSETSLRITEEGRVLSSASASSSQASDVGGTTSSAGAAQSSFSTRSGLRWEELPKAVQAAVDRVRGARRIAGISREEINGNVSYRITIADGGEQQAITVTEDGRIRTQ